MNISVCEEDLHHLKNLMETIKRGDYEFYPEAQSLQTIIEKCEHANEQNATPENRDIAPHGTIQIGTLSERTNTGRDMGLL